MCCQLCLHCHHEHVVTAGYDILPAVLEDQKALARLSRCSRRLRAIAQPVLFHWYHNGKTDDGQGGVDVLDRLVSFLRAIIQHPTLAASTHAPTLYEPLSSRYGQLATFADPEGSFGRVFEAVGGYLLQRWRNTNGQTLFLDQLQELAMFCLDRESEFSNCSWGVWSYPMPNLKFLAFAGNRTGSLEEETYDLKDALNLLRHAPNLDTLVAPDC
ncbi:hypothetical protein NEMBOFW57_004104 [Staphylotrichum longicolle]|uniref:Uncharacterized protein n=1 Tax=Staphylotrichum longicolle TaxID=669026 RepID=A0AAD4F6I5_9PEZI|nr:hypothetical protein NEMBOFW57_004104 [Staphylotrichum longicolle]